VFQYDGEPVTEDNWQASLRGDEWAVYGLELGNETSSYEPVAGLDSFTAYGDSFSTVVHGTRRPFLIAVEADFSAGNYYDVSGNETLIHLAPGK
jgi:hypothetical protein